MAEKAIAIYRNLINKNSEQDDFKFFLESYVFNLNYLNDFDLKEYFSVVEEYKKKFLRKLDFSNLRSKQNYKLKIGFLSSDFKNHAVSGAGITQMIQQSQNIISEFHPELNTHSMEEVEASCTVIRDDRGVIIDPLHRTIPFVTRYEKARAIGERAKQINSGAKPFVEIDQSMIDGYLIALKEFEEKKIPFIIRRPLPNGTSEYWRLEDLEILL